MQTYPSSDVAINTPGASETSTGSIGTSVVSSPRITYASDLLKEIDVFRNLQRNWGTNNEPSVSDKSCNRAQHFLSYFCFHCPYVNPHLYLTAGGEVAIDWTHKNVEYTVIFGEDEILLLQDEREQKYTNEISALTEIKDLIHV